MIINYSFSIVGKSHILKGSVCQDSSGIIQLDNGWYIAAVADGVGSAKNSHIGSRIAIDTILSFCKEYMPWDYSTIGIKSMLRTAYNYAVKQIIRESEKSGEPLESYDTTLSMVIYDGNRVVYGHSGDGAIIGLNTFGDYVLLTKPQKGADGISVLPLRSGYTVWDINSYEEDLTSVMIMTDGMLDTLCPYLLKVSDALPCKVYVPLSSFFADPYGFDLSSTEEDINAIKDFLIADDNYDAKAFYSRLHRIYKKHIPDKWEFALEQIAQHNYPIELMQKQQDDKSIVVLINPELQLDDKELLFYTEPDWAALQEEWNRKAYPHLYTSRNTTKEQNDQTEAIEVGNNSSAETTILEPSSSPANDMDSVGTMTKESPCSSDQSPITPANGSILETDLSTSIAPNSHPVETIATIEKGAIQTPPKHEKPKRKWSIF